MKTALKKFTVAVLCAALLVTGIQQARGHWLLYACVAGGTAIIGGITYFMVKSCRPKYYCMTDADGNRFYSNASRTEREANDWTITGGPYASAEEAAAGCVVTTPTTNNVAVAFMSLAQLTLAQSNTNLNAADEVFIPSAPMTIWRSADMNNWEVADQIVDDPENFTWIDTNAVNTATQMFYRVTTP